MNFIQYQQLLKLRSVTDFKGQTLAQVVEQSGGKPSRKEMVEVNYQSMLHYMNKFSKQVDINKKLTSDCERLVEERRRLQKRVDWLDCLEAAGVDNWIGCDMAADIRDKAERK